ncbi:MAG: YcaO-like family protein [Colwellia sp.]|nr:YcaO-like family protein [Colwellia sp.]
MYLDKNSKNEKMKSTIKLTSAINNQTEFSTPSIKSNQKLTTSVREKSAEDTLNLITPILSDFGILQVIDVSIDGISSCPVYQVTRKDMRSNFFNAGKGFTAIESKVSGLMEAIEVHCFERAEPSVTVDLKASENNDIKTISTIELLEPTASSSNDANIFVTGFDFTNNEKVLLPAKSVFLTINDTSLTLASPNGIASGNSFEEASCHAIYEMLERHALDNFYKSKGSTAIERVLPREEAIKIQSCLEELAIQDITAEFVLISNEAEVNVFICFLDIPLLNGARGAVQGFGAHHDGEISMARSLAEAIQILALCPREFDTELMSITSNVVITSKQSSSIDASAIHQARCNDHLLLKRIEQTIPLIEFEYMTLAEENFYLNAVQNSNRYESSNSTLLKLLSGLKSMGINSVYSCIISPPSLPVTVVKCFCPGLKCIDGL